MIRPVFYLKTGLQILELELQDVLRAKLLLHDMHANFSAQRKICEMKRAKQKQQELKPLTRLSQDPGQY